MANLIDTDEVKRRLISFYDWSARFAYEVGQHDCLLEAIDWLEFACRGILPIDLSSKWRGTYSTSEELEALCAPAGGLEQAFQAQAQVTGLEPASPPRTGDIGMVSLPSFGLTGAVILPSGRWRIKTPTGIVTTSLVTVVAAWGLPCRR